MNKLLSFRLTFGNGIYTSFTYAKEWEEQLAEYFTLNLNDPLSFIFLKCDQNEILIKNDKFKKDYFMLGVTYFSKNKLGARNKYEHIFIFDGPKVILQFNADNPLESKMIGKKIQKELINYFNLSGQCEAAVNNSIDEGKKSVHLKDLGEYYTKKNSEFLESGVKIV